MTASSKGSSPGEREIRASQLWLLQPVLELPPLDRRSTLARTKHGNGKSREHFAIATCQS